MPFPESLPLHPTLESPTAEGTEGTQDHRHDEESSSSMKESFVSVCWVMVEGQERINECAFISINTISKHVSKSHH